MGIASSIFSNKNLSKKKIKTIDVNVNLNSNESTPPSKQYDNDILIVRKESQSQIYSDKLSNKIESKSKKLIPSISVDDFEDTEGLDKFSDIDSNGHIKSNLTSENMFLNQSMKRNSFTINIDDKTYCIEPINYEQLHLENSNLSMKDNRSSRSKSIHETNMSDDSDPFHCTYCNIKFSNDDEIKQHELYSKAHFFAVHKHRSNEVPDYDSTESSSSKSINISPKYQIPKGYSFKDNNVCSPMWKNASFKRRHMSLTQF